MALGRRLHHEGGVWSEVSPSCCERDPEQFTVPHRHGQILSCRNVKGAQPLLWEKNRVLEVQKCLGKQECVGKWELGAEGQSLSVTFEWHGSS